VQFADFFADAFFDSFFAMAKVDEERRSNAQKETIKWFVIS